MECKRLRALTSTIIRDTCNRFLQNIEFWKRRNIDSFILCTTAELRTIQCISEVIHFWHVFRALKISFAVWDLPTLQRLERATSSGKVRLADLDETVAKSVRPQNKIGFLLMDKEVIKQAFELSRAGFEADFFSHINDNTSTSGINNSLFEDLLAKADRILIEGKTGPALAFALSQQCLSDSRYGSSWTFRRLFGGIASAALSQIDTTDSSASVTAFLEFVEHCLADSNLAVVVSMTLAKSNKRASEVPQHVLKSVLLHSHPQVQWEMLRSPHLITLSNQERRGIVQQIDGIESDWVAAQYLKPHYLG
jgi:hypothetical protein